MKNYADLDVFQRSKKLYPLVYAQVRTWRDIDQRELGSQIVRAANSIHANIAEGFGKSPAEFKRYLAMSLGSCDELLSHLSDAQAVGLLSQEEMQTFADEYIIVGKQLNKLRQAWR